MQEPFPSSGEEVRLMMLLVGDCHGVNVLWKFITVACCVSASCSAWLASIAIVTYGDASLLSPAPGREEESKL